ncbi:hypothetical protein GCM10027058_16860 [Microbacterium neimengense]
MRPRLLAVPGALLLAFVALTGCATDADPAGTDADPAPIATSESPTPSAGEAAALAQAQAWLDAAKLPPRAVRLEKSPIRFGAGTAWPCGPYKDVVGFWMVPGMTVVDAANWLAQNPTADLITTLPAPVSDEWGPVDSATVGYIPKVGAQEGVVYTVKKMDADVAIRAVVAAQTDTATCPPLPDGSMYGAPGQG